MTSRLDESCDRKAQYPNGVLSDGRHRAVSSVCVGARTIGNLAPL
jgi:hypothetical protein